MAREGKHQSTELVDVSHLPGKKKTWNVKSIELKLDWLINVYG